jgi:hypothetical protein
MKMSENKKATFLKWFAGISSSVIGGLLIWILTQSPNSPFKSPSKHSIKIAGFETTPTWLKPITVGTVKAIVNLYNEGNALGEDCTIFWHISREEYPNIYGLPKTETVSSFGIPPSQIKEIKLEHYFDTPGMYNMSILVSCQGGGVPETHVGSLMVK